MIIVTMGCPRMGEVVESFLAPIPKDNNKRYFLYKNYILKSLDNNLFNVYRLIKMTKIL